MDLTTLERLPLWIGGRADSPTTTRYGEVTNPATGEVIRHVPFANAADVDAAVALRPRAFPAWSTHACAAACARADEISRPARRAPQGPGERSSRRSTARRSPTPKARSRAASRWSSSRRGIPHLLKGEYSDSVGTDVDSWSMRAAGRRVRGHHAVQLPGDGADVDVPDRDRAAATRSC